jgi:Tfp pilus assembly protein PilF
VVLEREVRVRLFFVLRSGIYRVLVFAAVAALLPHWSGAGDAAGAQRSGAAAPAALDKIQLLCLKAGGVHDAELIRLLGQRGVGFTPTDDYGRDLSAAGAADDVIKALRSARIDKKAASQPGPEGGELYSHLARAAGLAVKQRNFKAAQQADAAKDAEKDAQKEYRAAIQLSPQNASLHFAFAGSLVPDEAIREYREVLRLDPGFARARELIGANLTLQAYHKLSWLRQPDADLLKQAASELDEAVRQEPENCQARTDLAMTLWSQKNLDASQAELTQAIRMCPQYSYPHWVLAQVLDDKGELDGAIAEVREAIRLGAHLQEYLDALLREKGNR